MTQQPRTPFAEMQPAQQAGILCNDPRFQRFAAARCGMLEAAFNSSAAAEYLRDVCGITSRRQLNDSAAAQARFAALRTEFDAWTGRIARQHPGDDRSQYA